MELGLLRLATVQAPSIPGLRFFDALVPIGHNANAEAIAADGRPIEQWPRATGGN